MKNTKIFYGWWAITGMVINISFLGPIASAIANLFQQVVTAEFGISNSSFAINNVIVLGIGMFVSPIVSRLLSGGKFKLTYLIGVFSYIVSLVGYSYSQNIFTFYFFSLFLGFGFITCTVIATSILVSYWFVEKRGLALSIAYSGLGIGGFFLSPIVTIMIANLNWRMTYLIYAITIAIIVIPVSLFIIPYRPEDKGLKPLGYKEFLEADIDDSPSPNLGKVQLTVRESIAKPFFILLVLGAVINGIVNNGGLGQFPPALTLQHGATQASIIVAVYSIIGTIGKLLLGHVADRYGVRIGLIYTSILFAISFVLMIFSDNQFIAYIMAIVFGIGHANTTVLTPLITSEIFPANKYSEAFGFVQSGSQLGMALGSFLVASIADYSGSYLLAWIVMGFLCVIHYAFWEISLWNAKKYSA